MSEFADRLMVKYLDPTNVTALLTPPVDTNRSRLRRLLEAVYELRDLVVREVDGVTVLRSELQVPVTVPVELRGSWEKHFPQSERAFAGVTATRLGPTHWLAMRLDTTVTAKVEVAAGALERLGREDLSGVGTLDEFKARFLFIDVPRFMREAGVTTLEELKQHLPQLLELRFAEPPAFDPDDPAATRTFPLTVCVLFFPDLDLEAALRAVKSSREAVEAANPHEPVHEAGEVRASCAWMAVFPDAGQLAAGLSATDVEKLFQSEGAVAAFETTA